MSNNRGKNGGLCDKLCDKIKTKTCFRAIFMSNSTAWLCDKKLTEKCKNEW